MDVQNRDRVYAQEIVPWTWGAFAEPRGWALKWVFTQQMAYHSVEQRPRDGKVPWNKFAESRAWALKWDGSALAELSRFVEGA